MERVTEPTFVVEYAAADRSENVFVGIYRDRFEALDSVYRSAFQLAEPTGGVRGGRTEREHPIYPADRGGKPAVHLCDFVTNGADEWYVYPVFFDDAHR